MADFNIKTPRQYVEAFLCCSYNRSRLLECLQVGDQVLDVVSAEVVE